MSFYYLKGCSLSDRVLIVADLHLDQWLASGRDPFAALDPDDLSQLDALIVAGDLSDKPKVRWPHALDHIAKYVDPGKTWIVPGNHDYYHHKERIFSTAILKVPARCYELSKGSIILSRVGTCPVGCDQMVATAENIKPRAVNLALIYGCKSIIKSFRSWVSG
jgi:hypothetical protein